MSGGTGFDRRTFLARLAAGSALVVGHDLFFSGAAHAAELRCCTNINISIGNGSDWYSQQQLGPEGGVGVTRGVKQVHLGGHTYEVLATKAGVGFKATTKEAPALAELTLPGSTSAADPRWSQQGDKVLTPVLAVKRGASTYIGVPALPGPAQVDAVTLDKGERLEVFKIAGPPSPNNKREHEFTLAGGAKFKTLVLVTQAEAAPEKAPRK